MYLFGVFVSAWVKRCRGRIVTVGIVIVIVLLSGGGGENSSEWIYAAWQWGQEKLRVDSMQICLNDCHYSLFS